MDVKDKIAEIIKSEKLNNARFSAQIGIQGSTLSHILNGRNNPSLDVLKSILSRYPNISPDWLILDIGAKFRSEKHSQEPTLFDDIDQTPSLPIVSELIAAQKTASSLYSNQEIHPPVAVSTEQFKPKEETVAPVVAPTTIPPGYVPAVESSSKRGIRKIIVYYTDHTFEEFEGH